MKIAILGAGYVGLVTGNCLAAIGHDVVCIDSNVERVANLSKGILPIFEPGLAEMVARNRNEGRLGFASRLDTLDPQTRAVFIAVGTPPASLDHSADLSAVFTAAEMIAKQARKPLAIITKSTVPVGTGAAIERLVRKIRPDLEIDVVSNPEFLREGSAISDFMHPDRIVIGTESPRACALVKEIYFPLQQSGSQIVCTSRTSAEMIKYAANAFLAAKISFINEIADLCEAADADIEEVSHGVGLDHRIGEAFLRAGPGYGGSCFPKDTEALLATAQSLGVQLRLVESTVAANEQRKRAISRRVASAVGGDLQDKLIAVLGLTFKPDTDDVRQAPSLSIIAALRRAGARVCVYDPEGMTQARSLIDGVEFAEDAYACVSEADGVILVTEWKEFSALDFVRVAQCMKGDAVIDLRNALSARLVMEAGLRYHGIGRKLAPPPLEVKARDLDLHWPPKAAVQAPRVLSTRLPNPFGSAKLSGGPLNGEVPFAGGQP